MKNISLERMDKIFGEIDFVEAGEPETATTKIEAEAVLEDTADHKGESREVGDGGKSKAVGHTTAV